MTRIIKVDVVVKVSTYNNMQFDSSTPLFSLCRYVGRHADSSSATVTAIGRCSSSNSGTSRTDLQHCSPFSERRGDSRDDAELIDLCGSFCLLTTPPPSALPIFQGENPQSLLARGEKLERMAVGSSLEFPPSLSWFIAVFIQSQSPPPSFG